MSEQHLNTAKMQLALAIAQGECIIKWAKANQVARATAFRWADEPLVRKAVAAHRRRTLEEVLSLLSKHAESAAEVISKLAKNAKSDRVRLSGHQAIRAGAPAPSDCTGLAKRVAAIEKRLGQRAQDARGTAASPEAAEHGQ
jgi:hypothetical protein